MAPAIIADSDDDEASDYSPPPKTPATRSHDDTNISTSTDSAFFRSVLEEQSEAARNASRTNTTEGSKSAVETFGSGGMMSTDPLQADEEEACSIDKAQRDEKGSCFVDPWEIPSSPGGKKTPPKLSTKKGPRKTPKEKQSAQFSFETTSASYDKDGRRVSKRRKAQPSQSHTQDDEIDLVQLPPTAGDDYGPSSTMAPPAAPSQRTPRVGKALTESQKLEYQSFPATEQTEFSQDQGIMKPEDGMHIARSSSSATNVNTPRSEEKSWRNMDAIMEEDPASVKREKGALDRQWGSSPDEISAVEPTPRPLRATKRKGPLTVDDDDNDKRADINYEDRDPSHHIEGNDKNPNDIEDEPAPQPKKQRGRPKKKAEASEHGSGAAEAACPTSPTTSHARAAEGRSMTKRKQATQGKRKRGRPKKAEQPAAEEAEEKRAQGTVASVHAATLEIAKPAGDNDLHEAHDEAKAAQNEATEPEIEKAPQQSTGAETEERRTTPSAQASTEEASEVKQPQQAKIAGSAFKPPGLAGSSSASKPLYRVGLSKKSRIAPLLKIRK